MKLARLLLVLALLAAAACGSRTQQPAAAPGQSDTGAPIASPSGSPRAGFTLEASPPPAEAPRAAAPSGTPAPVRNQNAATHNTPPAPGRYHYDQSGEARYGTFVIETPPEGTLDVTEAVVAREGVRFIQRRDTSSNQRQEYTFLATSDALLLEVLRITASQGGNEQTMECGFDDPPRLLPLPVPSTGTWSDGGSCDLGEMTFRGRGLRTESVEVGGESLDAVVVELRIDLEGEDFEQSSTQTLWYSPRYRLVARSDQSSEGSFRGIPFTSEFHERLRGTRPA